MTHRLSEMDSRAMGWAVDNGIVRTEVASNVVNR